MYNADALAVVPRLAEGLRDEEPRPTRVRVVLAVDVARRDGVDDDEPCAVFVPEADAVLKAVPEADSETTPGPDTSCVCDCNGLDVAT